MTSALAPERQVRLAGSGGQGVVLAGLLLAEAAVAAGKNATHAQAYGPESRGGATKADVIVSDAPIDYPYATAPDILVALTQEACDRYVDQVKPGGTILVDADRVQPRAGDGRVWHALPLFATARERLGTPVGANILALGALVGLCRLVPAAALEAAIASRRPGGSAEPGLRAFRAGLELSAPGAPSRADQMAGSTGRHPGQVPPLSLAVEADERQVEVEAHGR